MKSRIIGIISVFFVLSVVYAASTYEVKRGVKPGCKSGAESIQTVSAESELEACGKTEDKSFPYCCRAVKK
jgi:hypothetical protein